MDNNDFNNLARQAECWRTVANFVKENDHQRGSGESPLADDDIVDIVIRMLRDRVRQIEHEKRQQAKLESYRLTARNHND